MLQPYQQRVIEEKQELDEKINKLSSFINSEVFLSINKNERDRLKQQANVMITYSNILRARIDAFE